MILRDWSEGGGFRGRRRRGWSRSRVNWRRGEAGPARDLLTRSGWLLLELVLLLLLMFLLLSGVYISIRSSPLPTTFE